MSQEHQQRRVVYYDPGRADAAQPAFRSGEAGRLELLADGSFELETAFAISPNSCCALWGHGVVAELAPLAGGGPIEPDREVLLTPSRLEEAAKVFYAADRKTYGARYEFVAARAAEPEPVEYRLVVDNREYQRALNRLQFLATWSARNGRAVWLRL